jgi:hypothetical protein
MRHHFAGIFITGALALVPAAASAQSVAVTAGTQGFGAELGYDISDMIGVRAVGNYFSISHGVDGDDVNYDGDLRLLSFGLLGDIYAFETGFRFTGGGYINRNKVDITATPTGNVEIGGTVYTPAQLSNLDGRIKFNDFAPYAGIGYTGNRGDSGWSFIFDAGVMFQGGSDVTLNATGPATLIPGFAADLERERADIKDDVDDFKYYPVVKVGLAYRF